MLQTIEATIDKQGRVALRENVRLRGTRRALVTILDDEPLNTPASFAPLAGSAELLDDDLAEGSRQIALLFEESLQKTGRELNL